MCMIFNCEKVQLCQRIKWVQENTALQEEKICLGIFMPVSLITWGVFICKCEYDCQNQNWCIFYSTSWDFGKHCGNQECQNFPSLYFNLWKGYLVILRPKT